MSRRFSHAVAALITVPLLVVALALPAGLDSSVSPLAAGSVPLAWAVIVAIAAGLSPPGMAAAFTAAMPFSAYALAAYSPAPALPWLAALTAAAASATLSTIAFSREQSTGRFLRARIALGAVFGTVLGAAPGIAIAALGYPWGGAAVSVLVASIALLSRARSPR